MISEVAELNRLALADSDRLSATTGGYSLTVVCDCVREPASVVMQRVRDLLTVVIQHLLSHPIDYETEPGEFQIDEHYWRSVLPNWFLARTPFLEATTLEVPTTVSSPLNTGQWTVTSWLYWFLSPNEIRRWRWWNATVQSSARLDITLFV